MTQIERKVGVFYATREGQTGRIAEHLADALRAHGVAVDVHDVARLRAPLDWTGYSAVIVAASVHRGHHEKEMLHFVREHRPQLERAKAAFVSVSLSERGVEDPKETPERREQYAKDVQRMLDDFVAETGWRPAFVKPVAGALMYSRYNLLIRFVMKRIARQAGASTDTSRDHEFTDWAALDVFVESLLQDAAS